MSSFNRQIRSNIQILFLLNIGNVLAYLFQLVIARYMEPADYGAFNALNSLVMVLSAASGAIPLVVTRFVVPALVLGKGHVRGILASGLRIMGKAGLTVVVAGLVALPWIRTYVHVDDLVTLVMMLLICGFTLLYFVTVGVLQGLGRYIPMSIVLNSVSGGRLLGGIILVAVLGMGLRGAVLSCLLSCLLALGLGLGYLRDIYDHPIAPLSAMAITDVWPCAKPVLLSTTLIVFLGNIDVVFVRHYCEAEASGLYATAAVIARIANLFPGVLISLLFPEVVRASNAQQRNSHLLWINMGLTVAIGGGIALLLELWPEQLIILMMGETYRASGTYLGTIAIAMALLAVCNTVFTYWLGRGEYRSLWLLLSGALAFVLMVMLYHDSPQTIIRLLLASLVGVCAAAALRLSIQTLILHRENS